MLRSPRDRGCGFSCAAVVTPIVSRALGILWRFEKFAETATSRCTSRKMTSSQNTPPGPADGNQDDSRDKQGSTAHKPHLASTGAATQQKKFVTPTPKPGAHSDIRCPRTHNVIPPHVLADALKDGHQVLDFFAGNGNSAASESATRDLNAKAVIHYTQAELERAVFRPENLRIGGVAVSKNAKPRNQSNFAQDAADAPALDSPRQSVSPDASSSKHRQSKVAEKVRVQSPQRHSKEWSLDQSIALLTEVVEGETYIMVKKKKYEERTLVSRAKGIPHGKTNAFWDAIIEKLQSRHHFIIVKGKSQPLFPLAKKDGTLLTLKKDYVSGHFDRLVNKRLAQKEKRRSSAGSRRFGVNDDDFETGPGDDSEQEDKEDDKINASAAESDDRPKSDKAKQAQIDELLDAYLIQQSAHKYDVETASLFVEEDAEPKAGSKRPSGQDREHDDDSLIEETSNGNSKKNKKEKETKEKLPKLPMPTHVERSQAQSLEHASKMSNGFQALADSQKPSTVEDFKQKSAALVEQIGKTVAETATQAINAWSKYKSSARACVSDEGVHDWLTLREEPLRMVCKRCGNVIG